ncbi:DUF2892 domain-containing protein [Brevibacillus nitrificans]|uniref:DUF2892 domain-containing protein n=1 Tax=Brevibacillus nitrificans TaxID=651560 RepID=A0A3M8CSK2_9BACL|nr:DUF2892 domain-containing protein [Brevibacillus nitrificans]RNB78684.1 DUF2892 domain-containing protein [Brevibacillus nitrificans]
MHKNIGTTDAIIRITGGLLGLAYGIGKMSRRPYNAPWLLMAFSAMKVAEGVTRHCMMYRAMGISTRSDKGMRGMQDMIAQAKGKGFQMVMGQVARTLNARKNVETQASSTENSKASTAPSTKQNHAGSNGPRLSPEDEILEKAAREFVSFRSEDQESKATSASASSTSSSSTTEKSQSEQYSHDEHRYPTYS